MVTGAGGSAAVGFCRSLRSADCDYELIGIDCDKYHLNLAVADHTYLVPPASDPDYLPILNWIAHKHDADFLHSQPDVEVEFASSHRNQLAVETNLPEHQVVKRCLDKYQSYLCWQQAGIAVPETRMIACRNDLQLAFNELGPKLWLRNTHGAAGKGALPTSDYVEAVAWIDFCKGWGEFTAARCLTDESVTWQSIWQRGRLLLAQTRLRKYWEFGNRSPSGVTGLTGTGITLSDSVIDELAQRCIQAVDTVPNGIFSVDFTYDAEGEPNPTEINIGRFFTTHQFFTAAGVNFPDIYIRTSLNLPVDLPDNPVNPLQDGLAWVRGLDSEPVLTTAASIEAREMQRNELRSNAREDVHERSLRHTG